MTEEKTEDRALLPKVKACGVLVFRRKPVPAFLVLKHSRRLDLPKGHLEHGESETECALREMSEETGLPASAVELAPDFRYQEVYYPYEPQYGGGRVEKTLVVFLGWLLAEHPIITTEHRGYEWIKWNPPHQLQRYTFDPLLSKLEEYFRERNLP
ncbi:MAG: DNA mismatch repair protein MutT [Planctomycetaceae bacterium]|nr:MAG: DNA mismatch repair protein MutT [Planctomycetaceae bacterium]